MAPRRMRLGRPAVIADRPVCFLASGRWQGGRHVASPLFTCSCPARFAATPKAPRSPWFHPTADPGGGRGICRNARGLATGAVAARDVRRPVGSRRVHRSEEHTSELQSLMRISYAVFCLKKKKNKIKQRQ